ncbi:hypothetical protein CVT91_07045 [Candidatus Atribacteria bacterium HGW-Atribacteria-1]|nr:MAG: hypothetical protein CVT91_07045 [Candidatus Atribacteria bacterium HGW-Atribacteria-1]
MSEKHLLCLVFPKDYEAQALAKSMKNTSIKYLENSNKLKKIFSNNEYVAIIHSGGKFDSKLVSNFVNLALERETKLGFIVHAGNLSHIKLNQNYIKNSSKRHAIFNHANTSNILINKKDFWYAAGKHAKIKNLLEWQQRAEKPSVISFLSHSREDLIYAIDGMLCTCEFNKKYEGLFPSCYTTGTCYRNDLVPIDIGSLQANLIVLNGCATFKLGSDVFDARSTLVHRLVENGVYNIIGSHILKVGYIEELFLIHSQIGKKSLGEIVHHLNVSHKSGGTGVAPFALWGDPRTALPKIVNEPAKPIGEIGGLSISNFLVSEKRRKKIKEISVRSLHKEFELIKSIYSEIKEYETWSFLGLSTHDGAGYLSQINSLLRGALNLVSEITFIRNGDKYLSFKEKLDRIPEIRERLQDIMINYLIERTYKGGFHLTDSYREGFMVVDVNPGTCPSCKKTSNLIKLKSPIGLVRIENNCSSCGVVEDYPDEENLVMPEMNFKIENKKIYVKVTNYEGSMGVCIHSGYKYSFSSFKKLNTSDNNYLFFVAEIGDTAKPHRYQIKLYNIYKGKIVTYSYPFFLKK